MQSHIKRKTAKKKRPKLPWGMGSLKKHGRMWWATFRDPKGKVHFENLATEDSAEARRLLASRSLPRARAAVETLELIANEAPHQSNGEANASAARRDSTAERNARPRANRKAPQEAAGAGGTSPRARSPRKRGKAE